MLLLNSKRLYEQKRYSLLKLGGVFKSVSARAVQHSMGTFAVQLTCLRKVCGHVTVSDHRLIDITWPIKNGQSRETGNIGNTRRRRHEK
jgi:hypothetical protein